MAFTIGPQFVKIQTTPTKYRSGIGVAFLPEYRIKDRVGLGFLVGYSKYGSTPSDNIKLLQALFNARLIFMNSGDKLRPYFGFGAGIFSSEYTVPVLDSKGNNTGKSKSYSGTSGAVCPYFGIALKLKTKATLTADFRYQIATSKYGSSAFGYGVNFGLSFLLAPKKKEEPTPTEVK